MGYGQNMNMSLSAVAADRQIVSYTIPNSQLSRPLMTLTDLQVSKLRVPHGRPRERSTLELQL